ncbi:GIY-YIG nuclease family protein [Caballeronia glebae]|uniref:GIY-YIG nuclease family protein n=1 Tax=Caballeronia glebae TaxID=1777143 RepID=UPI0038BB8827
MKRVRERLAELTRGSNLDSLFNLDTQKMALYVVQNAHGLFKIGRSRDVRRRLIGLTHSHNIAVQTLLILEECGHFEEWIHLSLDADCVANEWFSGDDEGRLAIEALFGVRLDCPFKHDPVAAENWIEHIEDRTIAAKYQRRRRELVQLLKSAVLRIGTYSDYSEERSYPGLESNIAMLAGGYQGVSVGKVVTGTREGHDRPEEIPHYVRDIDAAIKLWSVDTPVERRRPINSALDCCLAALCDRWKFDEEQLLAHGCNLSARARLVETPTTIEALQASTPEPVENAKRPKDKIEARRAERRRYWHARDSGTSYDQAKVKRGPDKKPRKCRTAKANIS